jgi:signal transduction histidine kinase
MTVATGILLAEAVLVYLLVLIAHSLRRSRGLGPFYAMLGGLTALMSWVTDAGVRVEAGAITFVVGSTVFYTALLLGVFVVYVFDGPRAARIAILTVAGISILAPVVAALLHAQSVLVTAVPLPSIPMPSLRINTASVLTTVADLIFLAIAWEFLGKARLRIATWLRVYLTLLGVLCLDVLLFSTGAFGGTTEYLGILTGTLVSRLAMSIIAGPILFAYVHWQSRHEGAVIENRPVLAIVTEVDRMRAELGVAQQEIERRKEVESQLAEANRQLRQLAAQLHVTREQERAEVGWELHDEVAQTLSALKMDVAACTSSLDSQTRASVAPRIEAIDHLLDQTIDRLRRLYSGLVPVMLDDLGLTAAVQWRVEEFCHRSGVQCSIGRIEEVRSASRPVELGLFRVLEDTLGHIRRHEGLTKVTVDLFERDDVVVLRIADSGESLSAEELQATGEFGLLGVRERAASWGGSTSILRLPGGGTALEVTAPLASAQSRPR